MKFFFVLVFAFLAALPARAATVVELFTSQGCSSCPPADRAFAKLAQQEDIIALSCHVTYWDRLGWLDTLGREFCDGRQYDYAQSFGTTRTYTPQLVVNGRYEGVGSNPLSVHSMLGKAAKEPLPGVPAVLEGGAIRLSLPDMPQANGVRIVLIGFDSSRTEAIGGGENSGKKVTYVNTVTSLENIGRWDGTAMDIRHPITEQAENYVVLLQHDGGTLAGAGRVLRP